MAEITKAAFNTTYADSAGVFADNTTGLISEADIRAFATDIKDSIPFNLDGAIKTVKITISSAELLALFTTPKTLVAAQGVGTVIEWLSVFYFYDYNSVAYASNTSLDLKLGSVSQGALSGIINQTQDVYHKYPSESLAISTTDFTNQPLTLSIQTGNPTAGDSPLYCYVTYRVITL